MPERKQPKKQEAPERGEALHVKYRPKRLGEVIGHATVVDSLISVIRSTSPSHCYLFTGPAGVGKTTLGRIVAMDFGCDPTSIVEIDGATNSGKEEMVTALQPLQYRDLSGCNRALIVDECHRLSAHAWDAMLKTMEEMPAHAFIILCTTGGGKIPDTIVQRCQSYVLKPLRRDDIMDLLEHVADEEGMDAGPEMLRAITDACNGSARLALMMLAKVHKCESSAEMLELLQTVDDDNPQVIDLCRQLVSGTLSWVEAMRMVKAMDANPESVRIMVSNYVASCLVGNARDPQRLLDILEAFSKPFNPTDKNAPLLIALGRVIYP